MKIIRWLDNNFERTLIIIIFTCFTLITLKEVFTRFLFSYTTDWAEEICRGLFVYMIFLAAAYSCKYRRHLKLGFLEEILGKKAKRILDIFSDILFLILCTFVVYTSMGIVIDMFEYKTLVQSGTLMRHNFNLGFLTFSIPFGWTLMAIRIIQRQYLDCKGIKEEAQIRLEA